MLAEICAHLLMYTNLNLHQAHAVCSKQNLSQMFSIFYALHIKASFTHSPKLHANHFFLFLFLSHFSLFFLSFFVSLSVRLSVSIAFSLSFAHGHTHTHTHTHTHIRTYSHLVFFFTYAYSFSIIHFTDEYTCLCNLQSALLWCGTRPNEWGAQWDSNSLV